MEQMNDEKIASINEAITAYFKDNPKVEWIPVKEIMPQLIAAGIFYKDEKKGLPLRKILRALDKDNDLAKIPLLHAERKGVDTYWYFVREGAKYVTKDIILPISNKQQAALKRENSDEYYLIGLCNELLNEKAIHQHTFNFLWGDYHKDGKTRTKLPLDAYYVGLNTVVELFEKEDESADEEKAQTISNMNRSEQRKKYAQRKREVLEEKKIHLMEIDYDEFECNKENRLVRNKEADVKVLEEIFKDFLK